MWIRLWPEVVEVCTEDGRDYIPIVPKPLPKEVDAAQVFLDASPEGRLQIQSNYYEEWRARYVDRTA